MLALGRRVGERVLVGPDVWVTVLEIKQGRVRLGFEGPQTVNIAREEVLPEDRRYAATRGEGK